MIQSHRYLALRMAFLFAGITLFQCSSSSTTPTQTGSTVALMGTAEVTNGSTGVTFTTAQTLGEGAQLEFSSQAGVPYTVAAATANDKTATLTKAYDGTTSTSATVVEVTSSTSNTVKDAGVDANTCYPDNDGINGGDYTIDLVVTDTGFYASGPDAGMKSLLSTQNDAEVTLTLTNKGTKDHGFKVGCTSVLPSYPNLPAGCPTSACFPANSFIAPIAPNTSKTITFDTPTPDGLIYPFTSNEPADSNVAALNDGQWSLM
jgi:hypothetical protein